jgi:hypothetical protein
MGMVSNRARSAKFSAYNATTVSFAYGFSLVHRQAHLHWLRESTAVPFMRVKCVYEFNYHSYD